MLRIGLLLSGCGTLDGSDPTQVVLWRLVAVRRGHLVIPVAPDVEQHDVVGPRGPVPGATRRVHDEARRLTAGLIENVDEVQPDEIDALVVPGGMGAVKTLCDAAVSEPVRCLEGPARLARALIARGGVVVAVDEACVWAAHVLGERPGVSIASDGRQAVDADIRSAGHHPVAMPDEGVVVDTDARTITHWMDPTADAATLEAETGRVLDALESLLRAD